MLQFSRGWFSTIYQGLKVHPGVREMFYSKYGLCWSDCNGPVLSQLNLEPYASIVGDNDGGSSKGCVVGGHRGLYSPCDVLSSNVVLGPARKFSRDAVFVLQVNGKGASKGS
jgi:hypothetical protein